MKNQKVFPAATVILVVAVLAGLFALTWGNYRYTNQNSGGKDFLVYWAGTRALIMEGLNPYSDEVAEKIQTIAYGHPAQAGETELRFIYPLYSIVFFLPFSLVPDFPLARAMWMTLLEVALIGLTLLSLRLVRWRIGVVMLAFLLLFALFWFHGLRPLITGDLVILVAVFLVMGFLALRAGADELAGVLFAFTTVKPEVVILVLVFVIIWAAARGRWRVVGWMGVTVVLLTASTALLIPTWMVDNLREVIRYSSYSPPGTPRAVFINWWPAWGSRVGWALTAIMGLTLLLEWWSNRRSDFPGFLWTACLTLVTAQWIGISTAPINFIVLFPALMLVFSQLDDRWRTGGRFFVILSILVLFGVLWAIFLNTVEAGGQSISSLVLFFPLPAYLFVTLFWVRWWAIEPPAVWFDHLDGR